MSSYPFKTLHVSPSSRDHPRDPVGAPLCPTNDQMLGSELIEMSEVEYSHFQHLIQDNVGRHAASPPDSPASITGISPVTTTQAIDLSTTTDEHCLVMPGEKTPASYGEVPDFVLDRVRGEDSPTKQPGSSSSSSGSTTSTLQRSAARVCLEERFNTMFPDTPRQQNIQSTVLSNFLTILHQSTEAQEAVQHPQMHKWMKTDRVSPFEVYPVTMCEQVIGHIPNMVEPKEHQGLIIPKNFMFNFHPERLIMKGQEQQLNRQNNVAPLYGDTCCSLPKNETAAPVPDSAGQSPSKRKRARSHMLLIQRKERHNCKERERRKRIRSYCDELNLLVPFCESATDKVTTLQWTTAFLRYINRTYGDAFKQEFQKAFTDGKSSPPGGHLETETHNIPHAVEQ